MITVPEAVKEIVFRSPYLLEALKFDLLNISNLSRRIQSEVENKTFKEVKVGSIIMSLQRLKKEIFETNSKINLENQVDIIVRSKLFEVTVNNSEITPHKLDKILKLSNINDNFFITITQGIFETTIVASLDIRNEVLNLFSKESLISEFTKLSSITIKFAKNITDSPGVYSQFLNQLAWNGISLIEIVSTYSELTLILEDKNVSDAFSIIKKIL